MGFGPRENRHWFGVPNGTSLCSCCWEPPAVRANLLLLPTNTRRCWGCCHWLVCLLQQVRPWIEPAQSYEKNQLGLSQMFFNSLRLTWCMALLADAAVLLVCTRSCTRRPNQACCVNWRRTGNAGFGWGTIARAKRPVNPTHRKISRNAPFFTSSINET